MLFSGRFDPPHLGHAITVYDLLKRYRRVIVMVLDYADASLSIAYRIACLRAVFEFAGPRVYVVSNREHFARITQAQLDEHASNGIAFDVYGSGNDSCLRHMESLGYETEYVPRSMDLSATELRVGRSVIELTGGARG